MAQPSGSFDTLAARDGIQLHCETFAVAGARAGLVLVHGFAEHCGRYGRIIQALNDAGISVMAYDARGHGKSSGTRAFVSSYGEYVDDLQDIVAKATQRFGGAPFVLGHSQGGLVTLRYLDRAANSVRGAILSNPALTNKIQVPLWKIALAHTASKLQPKLAVPTGLSGKDVSRDPEIQREYDEDPLNCKAATARWYTEFLGAQQEALARPGVLRSVPTLAVLGDGDRVIDCAVSTKFFAQATGGDLTVKMYPGFFHELLNEPKPDRERVAADIVTWLQEHIG